MASPGSKSNQIGDGGDTSSSYFKKTVSLRDWWLVKSDQDDGGNFHGKRLAVAGFTCGERQALRVFHSAAIEKRFDVFTLETSDGIVVTFEGLINKQKTIENGFSSEVFNHFLFGFPLDWEEYAENCFKQASPKANDIGNVENDTSKRIEDNKGEEIGLSSSHAVESFERLDDSERSNGSKSKNKGKKLTGEANNTQPFSLENVTVENCASEECSIPKDACVDNHNAPDLDQKAITESNNMVPAVPSKQNKSKKYQILGNMDGVKTGITNFSTASSQGSEAREPVLSTSAGDSKNLQQPSNLFKDTITFSPVQTATELNDVTPSMLNDGTPSMKNRDSVDSIPNNSGRRKCSKPLGDLKDNRKQKLVSGSLVQNKRKKLTPEVIVHQDKRKLRMCSHSTHRTKVNVPEAMLKTTRSLKNLLVDLGIKEKNEELSVKRGCTSIKKARRKIIFDTNVTPLAQKSVEKIRVLSPESLGLKRSRSGRLLLPTLHFWRNQIPVYDMDGNVTGIQEELEPSKGSKSEPQKKQKRNK